MSSREQIYLEETIKSMKKKIARDAIESDSDSEIMAPTNRGNKLKQNAKFVREGKLGPPTGPAVYKQEVEHAGYRRAIINRNPPLVDEDGYDIDSDDDDDRIQEAMAAAAEANPYATIHLEQLLAPLTSVTELPTHPTLSRPFTSTALTELAAQGCGLMHKENAALAKVRPLLTRLCGDHTWANCDMFLGPNDSEYFDDRYIKRVLKRKRGLSQTTDGDRRGPPRLNGGATVNGGDPSRRRDGEAASRSEEPNDVDVAMKDTDAKTPEKEADQAAAEQTDTGTTAQPVSNEPQAKGNGSTDIETGLSAVDLEPGPTNGTSVEVEQAAKGKGKEADPGTEGGEDVEMADESSHVKTRSINGDTQLQPNDNEIASLLASLMDENFIHPMFLAPKSAHPDRDLGLPDPEAEDVRRLLQLYVQKQEEVCRGARRLYEGLLRADRLRKTVLRWSKAEAHCGSNRDMSDGEDWYDKEEWGLTEDLKKGQDEEEEDTTQTQKKTRNRNK